MKLEDAVNAADGLDPKNRLATAKMIDTKVESDMEKALTVIRSEFVTMRNELGLVKTELMHVENKFSTVYWVVGLMIGFSTALLGIIIALK